MKLLRCNFPGRLRARSLDQPPLGLFLLGIPKAQFFKCRPQTTDELKILKRHEIAAIPEAMQNFRVKFRKSITRGGKRFDNLQKKVMIITKQKWQILMYDIKYLPNPSRRIECDTRSILKISFIGFNIVIFLL